MGSDGTKGGNCIDKCVKEHEDSHHSDTECTGSGEDGLDYAKFKQNGDSPRARENKAGGVEIGCLEKCRGECQGDPDCLKRIKDRISQLQNYKGIRHPKPNPPKPQPPPTPLP